MSTYSKVTPYIAESAAVSATMLPPGQKVVFHGPNDKPEKPPGGHVHTDKVTGIIEEFDGQKWVIKGRVP